MKRVGLTAITIENFKSIGAPVTIPLRPITLLFGANSVGKSTVIQAMQYMHEVLAHRNPDPDYTTGAGVDLGGFRNLVHDHDLSRRIRLRFELNVDDDGLAEYPWEEFGYAGPVYAGDRRAMEEWERENREYYAPISVNSALAVDSVWLEVETGWVAEERKVEILRYSAGINGERVASIQYRPKSYPALDLIAWAHPLFGAIHEDQLERLEWASWKHERNPDGTPMLPDIEPYRSVVPEMGKPYRLAQEEHGWDEFLSYESLWSLLSQVLIRPGELLLDELDGLRYVGPIRTIPPRHHAPPKRIDKARWADGMAAWDLILGAERDAPFVESANGHLRDTLQLGYTVERVADVPLDLDGPIMAELRMLEKLYEEKSGDFLRERVIEALESQEPRVTLRLYDWVNGVHVHPRDIGVGVSQVVPVVLGLAAGKYSVFAVEQPELHVHPAVQARLADVFIRELLGEDVGDRVALIETHSEHFILRLLRRVREAAEGELPEGLPAIRPDDIQVLYLKAGEMGMTVHSIAVTDDGDFAERWPDGFFTEREEDLF